MDRLPRKVDKTKVAETIADADKYAAELISDFVRDRLDGNLTKLRDFNLSTLYGDEKYGNTDGYGFIIEQMAIVKAICSVVYKPAWPELSYYGIHSYEYSIGLLNTSAMLLGCPVGDEFKGMTKFNPTPDQLKRAWSFYHLHHTIGNYVVWPSKGGSLVHLRESIPRRYRYVDVYLSEIHKAMDDVKKMQMDVKATIYGARKYFKPYHTAGGFAEMCHRLMLDDYLDFHGKSIILFGSTWSDQKELPAKQYFKAFDNYLTFCEQVIPRRSDLIIKRLTQALL